MWQHRHWRCWQWRAFPFYTALPVFLSTSSCELSHHLWAKAVITLWNRLRTSPSKSLPYHSQCLQQVAARSNKWLCAARLLTLRFRMPSWARVSVVIFVRWQVMVCAAGWSLVQRSPTDCGVQSCVIAKPRQW